MPDLTLGEKAIAREYFKAGVQAERARILKLAFNAKSKSREELYLSALYDLRQDIEKATPTEDMFKRYGENNS